MKSCLLFSIKCGIILVRMQQQNPIHFNILCGAKQFHALKCNKISFSLFSSTSSYAHRCTFFLYLMFNARYQHQSVAMAECSHLTIVCVSLNLSCGGFRLSFVVCRKEFILSFERKKKLQFIPKVNTSMCQRFLLIFFVFLISLLCIYDFYLMIILMELCVNLQKRLL